MAHEHAQSVRLAERATAALERLLRAVGNTEHPNGTIWRAYRVARRALRLRTLDQAALDDALVTLRLAVTASANTVLTEAAQAGAALAVQQLAVYDDQPGSDQPLLPALAALAGIVALVESQRAQARALFAATGDRTLLLGDADRVGLLAPGVVVRDLSRWVVVMHQEAWAGTIQRTREPTRYRRQAVATVGSRTTDCCLRVHGQVVDRDQPFILTGTPRYADAMLHPPFHPYCRTVEALVRATDADDDLTARMVDAADAERTARREGTGTTARFRSGTAVNT